MAALAVILMTPAVAAAHSEYVVESGDSLSVIAHRHGVSVSVLAADNGISNLHLIRVGQVLRIPDGGATTYTVKAGDTLSEIAAAAGISTRALVDANGIENAHFIRVGQKLTVPAGARTVPTDPAAGYNSLPSRLRANPSRLTLIPSFEKWSNHYGVPTDLVMAVAYRESGWQTQVVSPKGAIGVGQILPRTADWIAGDLIQIPELDPYNPDDNIRMTARFLSWLIGYMGSTDAALAGYYQGPGSVAARGYYDDTRAYIENIGQIRRMFAKG
ncbi:MAG: LysM peptidoglycan-binding domain-containing protein [Acidimicrobiia bacterium]|nr:LysM peptidoglycan-binding domain-containing protein [Acidimicrobiia bacterium]